MNSGLDNEAQQNVLGRTSRVPLRYLITQLFKSGSYLIWSKHGPINRHHDVLILRACLHIADSGNTL